MGVLGLNTDLNWSFKVFAFKFLVSVKGIWTAFFKGAMPVESCLECLSKEYRAF